MLKSLIVSAAIGVYAKDCYHVLSVYLEHSNDLTSERTVQEDTEEIRALYESEDGRKVDIVTVQQFHDELEKLISKIRQNDSKVGIASLGLDRFYQVNRESCAFLGGGRAALLQLAHPCTYFALLN